MGNPKTVRIEDGDGFRTINESDFDKKDHKLFKEKAAEPKKPTVKVLKAKLDELKIKYTKDDKQEDLIKLLADAEAGQE